MTNGRKGTCSKEIKQVSELDSVMTLIFGIIREEI